MRRTRRKSSKPRRLLYRAGFTRDELDRLIAEIGYWKLYEALADYTVKT